MHSDPGRQFDVLVIGGGPAGMAAAVCAAECGVRVGIVDDNPSLGGQIWRGVSESGESENRPTGEPAHWLRRMRAVGVTTLCGLRAFHSPEAGVLLAESRDDLFELRYRNLILATGARERFLPFPGWTLPNVLGAGGLQALVKSGLPIQDKRVVVAGTGPLLLAVAAYLREHGAKIVALCEQTSWLRYLRFGMSISLLPGKMSQAIRMSFDLFGIRAWANCWPVAAGGKNRLESVQLSRNGRIENVDCDYLACGFHLIPNIELPRLAGCRLQDGYVEVDDFQRTSVPHVFCAGEPTGIGGVELSLLEGQIAGYTATNWEGAARQLFSRRATFRRAVGLLQKSFELRPELKALAKPDTFVCRCE